MSSWSRSSKIAIANVLLEPRFIFVVTEATSKFLRLRDAGPHVSLCIPSMLTVGKESVDGSTHVLHSHHKSAKSSRSTPASWARSLDDTLGVRGHSRFFAAFAALACLCHPTSSWTQENKVSPHHSSSFAVRFAIPNRGAGRPWLHWRTPLLLGGSTWTPAMASRVSLLSISCWSPLATGLILRGGPSKKKIARQSALYREMSEHRQSHVSSFGQKQQTFAN